MTHSLTHPLTNSSRRHTWLRLQQQPRQTRRLEAIPWDALATERSIRRNCAVTVTTMISQLDHPKKSLIFSGTGHTDLFVFLVACFIPPKGKGWVKKISISADNDLSPLRT